MDITTTGKLNRFIKNLSKRVSDHPLITSVVLCLLFFLLAVIFCEPVIWCVMAVQLVITFYTNSFIKEGK